MTPAVVVRDTVSRVTPLGIRFWDPILDSAIGDGLDVVARMVGEPRLEARGYFNHSAVVVFRDLPGLREAEFGSGDEAWWNAPPPSRRFNIGVTDRTGRFLPMAFEASAVARDLFVPASLLPVPFRKERVPLYSSPARPLPPGMGAIRAHLLDAFAGAEAGWTLVEARYGRILLATGLADERGRVGLYFPWPRPIEFLAGSPMVSQGPPLTSQEWPVELRFFSARLTAGAVPDLSAVLAQPQAQVSAFSGWDDHLNVRLQYGKELIVRAQSRSELLIAPAVSPP